MRLLLRLLLLALLLLVGVLYWNTSQFSSRQLTDVPAAPDLAISDSVAVRLSQAVQFRTVSYQDESLTDTTQYDAFVAFLEKAYPNVHAKLERERFNHYSLLYKWQGSDPSLKPILLMGHYDVVPVIQGTEKMWKKPPFGGLIEDGFVYGRGTLDDKSTVIGLLEAVELMLKSGYAPTRSIYLSFGHDEEVSGHRGGRTIARALEQRGLQFEMILDEGGVIKTDGIAGKEGSIALIGVAEKGYMSVELLSMGEGGHSSMPPTKTSIGMLATALDQIQKSPFPSGLSGTVGLMLDYIGPEMPFLQKMAIANRWLFSPVLVNAFASTPSGAASTHTTIAPTILRAGIKDNVLPIDASATINFRILPGDSIKGVLDHLTRTINNPDITVSAIEEYSVEPSPVSPPEAEAFGKLHRTIKSCYPEVLVSPYLVLGATDARHFRNLSPNIYRFTPYQLNEEDLKRPHGTNERISVKSFQEMVRFYATLIQNTSK